MSDLGTKEDHVLVRQAISRYARGYAMLDDLQRARGQDHIPIGDQKTGAIGEYYASLYLRWAFAEASVTLADPSQKGWDLRVADGSLDLKYQVKTVSGFSETSRISPIHPGWDRLLLVRLGRALRPIAMWEVPQSDAFGDSIVSQKTMPSPAREGSGSEVFSNRRDVTNEFFEADRAVAESLELVESNVVRLIIQAIQGVDAEYFELETVENGPIKRERVFCYEMYHQMRLLLEEANTGDIRLHGEIDKSGHPRFRREDQRNPDFVFHIPGTMTGNLAVVEVKSDLRDHSGIEKDIETILRFLDAPGYKLGVLVFVGRRTERVAQAVHEAYRSVRARLGSQGAGTISWLDDPAVRSISVIFAPSPSNVSRVELSALLDND